MKSLVENAARKTDNPKQKTKTHGFVPSDIWAKPVLTCTYLYLPVLIWRCTIMKPIVEKKTTYPYMEYLRVLCVIAVVVVHVSGENWFHIDIGSGDWIVQTIYNLAGRFSVCVFCMITGALLLQPDKQITTQKIFSHYIRRILTCFAAWVVLYALLYTVLNHEGGAYFVSRLFKLPDHLWYPLMISSMYLAVPILREVTKNRQTTLYMIWLNIAFCVLVTLSQTSGFFDEIAGDSYSYSLWKSFLGNMEETKVTFVPGYLGAFLMGHYIHEYGLGKWRRLIVYSALPALILSGVLTICISMATGRYVWSLMLEKNPLVLLGSAGIFGFFKGEGNNSPVDRLDPKVSNTMIWLGGNAFGVYLTHFAFREILTNCFNFNVASYPAIVSVPANSLLILLLSLGLTALLKKIPFVRIILE